jgi:biopolymer transport protein TolR
LQAGRTSRHGLAEINVTPLVDVMLVLLIIFMVSAPMMQQGVPLKLPQADAAPAPPDKDALVISITASRDIFVGEAKVPLKALGEKLKAIREEDPSRQVFLRADEGVPYGAVVRVLATVERAGIHDIGMLTDPEGK